MGKVSSYMIENSRFLEVEGVTCVCCDNIIPDDEFNSLDDKYKEDPVCEVCWENHKNM